MPLPNWAEGTSFKPLGFNVYVSPGDYVIRVVTGYYEVVTPDGRAWQVQRSVDDATLATLSQIIQEAGAVILQAFMQEEGISIVWPPVVGMDALGRFGMVVPIGAQVDVSGRFELQVAVDAPGRAALYAPAQDAYMDVTGLMYLAMNAWEDAGGRFGLQAAPPPNPIGP